MQQRNVLQKESDETNKVVKDLKSQEKQLLNEIEKNRRTARQLDKAVQDIIRREIELARKKAEEEERRRVAEEERKQRAMAMGSNAPATGSKIAVTNPGGTTPGSAAPPRGNTNAPASAATTPARKPAPNYNLSLTPEAAALSSSLESNRGRLPWPVEKGFISESFGRHPHPEAPKVMVEQSGVDIQTSAGATARAVFDGTVSNVFSIDGSTWNVLITHGAYFTLYAKLASASVKKGQTVKTKPAVGTVATNDDGAGVINFQIWKGGQKMDPAGWIAR
jgi:septal ring factor EnvC (AmiA/AmiB activator)